jgi:SAM-dependent methyltransferase
MNDYQYEQVKAELRRAYDQMVEERDAREVPEWKVAERDSFLALLQAEGKRRLLEIGAGPGRDSLFLQEQGLEVVSTDLSPENVARCRAKGLTAYEMDFLHLDFPDESFDAVYALNCLLHVPRADLPAVLQAIQRVLKPDGLFYMGLYGGLDREGARLEDHYEPKRFFSYHTDEGIQEAVRPYFTIVKFGTIIFEEGPQHFQALTLRR